MLVLISRHYFENAICAQLDPSIRVDLHIERIGETLPLPAAPSDGEVAKRLQMVQTYVKEHSVLLAVVFVRCMYVCMPLRASSSAHT